MPKKIKAVDVVDNIADNSNNNNVNQEEYNEIIGSGNFEENTETNIQSDIGDNIENNIENNTENIKDEGSKKQIKTRTHDLIPCPKCNKLLTERSIKYLHKK